MTILGLCTHFTQTDEWAFNFAFSQARRHGWQMNICHWLHSPYQLRRDLVQGDLFLPGEPAPATPKLLTHLERQLREYYDPKLGDYTDVAFKLCEGQYQVELVRCLRKNLLDLVVMGYQLADQEMDAGSQPLEIFAYKLQFPLILVGRDGPQSILLNAKAVEWLDQLRLPEGSWEMLELAEYNALRT
jgi:hypothetical protein